MAKRKHKYTYSKNEDYLSWFTGKITKIAELNKEYEFIGDDGIKNFRFKCVFSVHVPENPDNRFETCISWSRQIISIDDLVLIKGRFLDNAFLVKKLNILRKAQEDNLLLSNSPKGQEFETSPNKCTSSAKLIASPTAAQEDINGNIQNST